VEGGGAHEAAGVTEAPILKNFFNQIWLSKCRGGVENITSLKKKQEENGNDEKYVFYLDEVKNEEEGKTITVVKENNIWKIKVPQNVTTFSEPTNKTWAIVLIKSCQYEDPVYFYINNISSVDKYFSDMPHRPNTIAPFKDMTLEEITFIAADTRNVKSLKNLFSSDHETSEEFVLPEKRKALSVKGLQHLNVENVKDFRYMFDNDRISFEPNELSQWKPKKDACFYKMFLKTQIIK
jgi:hypothetical protein